ncbi:MAG: class F sortase [bacterium]|nr:class F sortase [bacterium]
MKRGLRFSTILILVVMLVAGSVFATTFRRAIMAPNMESEITTSDQEAAYTARPQGSPERLIIPTIGVDAVVQHVGVGKSGNMAVPTNYTDVGWYRYGPQPGDRGTAVFDGHLDNGLGLQGVFSRLRLLNPGDVIFVKTDREVHVQFRVTHTDRVSADLSSTGSIFNESGNPQIKLITCEGEWDPETKSYSNRLIVTAERVS